MKNSNVIERFKTRTLTKVSIVLVINGYKTLIKSIRGNNSVRCGLAMEVAVGVAVPWPRYSC